MSFKTIAFLLYLAVLIVLFSWCCFRKKSHRTKAGTKSMLHLDLTVSTNFEVGDIANALRSMADAVESGRFPIDDSGGTQNIRYDTKWNLFESFEIPCDPDWKPEGHDPRNEVKAL